MNSTLRFSIFAFSALLVAGSSGNAAAQQATMSFFVTSAGSGKGADLGGLAGADRICQRPTAVIAAKSMISRDFLAFVERNSGAESVDFRAGRGNHRGSAAS
jgi:hypothetical protein